MAEKKVMSEAPEAKAKAPKKPATTSAAPAAKKAAAVKAPAKAAKKPAVDKASASTGKTITLIQTGSPIGRQGYQRSTLIGLGLNKMHRERTLIDTPSIRGMIEKVKHLVAIIEA